MDGAVGTELRRAGLPDHSSGELWNLTHPDCVRAVHEAYAGVGAEVLLTNTFQANPAALARHGLEGRLEEINAAAVRLARRAAGPQRFILGDVGPILEPGKPEFADRHALHRVLASLEGADGILFETCSSPAALAAVEYALHRVGDVEGLPLLLSLAYRRDAAGRLVSHSGHPPETYARHAQRHGVAALGVNCGRDVGLDEVIEVVRRYRAVTDLPLFARPNAGTPVPTECGWAYPLGPQELADRLPDLLAAGANMVGGCCGTTPAHIALLARRAAGLVPAG
jgi:5-methyltetrahydrofolate--homocysteine methyltransferase